MIYLSRFFLSFALLGCSCLMMAGAVGAPAGPLIRINRFVAPPTLDGRGDDPCWSQALEVNDFQHMGTHQPVEQGETRFRLGYDEEYLYVYARCEEPLLSVASQRRHEIRANATEHDGDVMHDDSFWLMLVPPQSREGFDIAVNTLGVVEDARGPLPEPWEGRDLSWESGVKVAATSEDGFWSVEMAIPWRAFPHSPPKAGDRWQVAIARQATARLEYSSWNRSLRGAHEAEAFGEIVFGERVPAVRRVFAPAFLETGRNPFSLQAIEPQTATTGDHDLTLVTEVADAKGQVVARERSRMDLSSEGKREYPFEVPEIPMAYFRWSLENRGTLEQYYRSPIAHLPVESSFVELAIQTEGDYRLIVNDQVIDKGYGKANARISLQKGVNVIAVEAATGAASLKLTSPMLGSAPLRWKMAEASLANATNASTDDGEWLIAPAIPESDAVGEEGTAKVFRHTVLLRQTQVWPVPQPAFYVAGGTIQSLNLLANGIPGRPFRDWEWEVEVSPGLELAGCTGFNGNREDKSLQDPTKARYTLHAGDREGYYRVSVDKPVIYRQPEVPILWMMEMLLKTTGREGDKVQKVQYSARANGGALSELRQEQEVRLLPEIAGRQPKRINWQFWAGWLESMDDHAMRSAILKTARDVGFTEVIIGKSPALTHEIKALGMTPISIISFVNWSIDLSPYLSKNPEARLTAYDGAPREDLMCTSLALGEGWSIVDECFQKVVRQHSGNDMLYDFEYRAINGPHSCYCARCLGQFAAAAGLQSAEGLTPLSIEQNHADAWVDFMARRVARLLSKMKASVHAVDPALRFGVYSGYQTEDNPSRYGIDWRYIAEEKAVDMAGCGYGRPLAAMQATLDAMKETPVLFGELVTPYLSPKLNLTKPAVQLTTAKLLRHSLDTPWGLLIYDRNPMDGRSWQAIAETTRLVAEYESLFLGHHLRNLAGQDPALVQFLEGEGKTLLFVMNTSQKQERFVIDLPEDLGGGVEYFSRQSVSAGARLDLELPGGGSHVYVFEKQATAATPDRSGVRSLFADETSGRTSRGKRSQD